MLQTSMADQDHVKVVSSGLDISPLERIVQVLNSIIDEVGQKHVEASGGCFEQLYVVLYSGACII
jgi:hypothetical protein